MVKGRGVGIGAYRRPCSSILAVKTGYEEIRSL